MQVQIIIILSHHEDPNSLAATKVQQGD